MLKIRNQILRRSTVIHRGLIALLTLAVLISLPPLTASAQEVPPAALGAPEHFGVGYYMVDFVYYTFSVPDDVRAYIEKRAADDPENKQTFSLNFQVDYKIDSGSWHYTPEWDSPKTALRETSDRYLVFANGKYYHNSDRWGMTDFFPEDESLQLFYEGGWNYLKSHAITFRVRFAESYDGGQTYLLSPWSKEYTLSAKGKADYNKLMNHAPVLMSAEVKKYGEEPYFDIKTGKLPGEIQDLNAMTGGAMRTQIWMRKAGEADFKKIEPSDWFAESLDVKASEYFDGAQQNYDAESYEIKVRYELDLRAYKQSGYADHSDSVYIYSPFSNVIAHNMPAWSNASSWATEELKKADELGLIPDILRGADLTRPITRKEFAAVSVKLYEKLSGKTAVPAATNPFKDTWDQEVLKAYNVGITAGVTADKFAPDVLLNREQAATMLTRVFKKSFVQGWTLENDAKFAFNYTVPPKFADDPRISDWAKPSVYFMVAHGIISGVGGNNFAPKATTSAEQAANYASATREQALAISVRMTEKLDATDAGEIVPAAVQSTALSTAAPAGTLPTRQAASTEPAPSTGRSLFPSKAMPTKDSIVGVWIRVQANVTGTLAGTMARHYFVFYPNGTFMRGIPDTGLYAFDFEKRKATANAETTIPDYGTYTYKNGKGQLVGNNGAVWTITMDSRYGSLDIGNYKGFLFILWLDGKRLDGAFTTITPNANGVITKSAIAQEPESFLYLYPDGTFDDRYGIFRWQGKDYPTPDEHFPTNKERDSLVRPAKGTYQIVDFSLILHYEDGVTTKHRILLDIIEMGELDYSSAVLSPKQIYLRWERARSNLKYFQ